MVGTNFPYTKFLPAPGKVHGRADRHRAVAGRHPHPDRRAAGRRRRGDPGGAAAPAAAAHRPAAAGAVPGEDARLAGTHGGARNAPTGTRSRRSTWPALLDLVAATTRS